MTQEEQDFKAFMDTMQSAAKRFGLTMEGLARYTNQNVKAENASAASKSDGIKQNQKLSGSIRDVDYRFNQMSRSAESFVGSLSRSSNIFLEAIGVLAEKGMELGKSWQEMSNIGETFGGSMIKMMGAAGDAGMSLDDFVKINEKHSVVIKSTNGRYFDMQNQLRKVTSSAGNYGMTVEGLNDFLSDNLEISRKNGTEQSKSTESVVKDNADLMATTTALSGATGVARDKMMDLTKEALGSALAIAGIQTAPAELRDSMDKSAKEVTMAFASIPGEAGGFFSKFYADSLSGQAQLTDGGKELIAAGLSGFVSKMNDLGHKAGGTFEDSIDYQNEFKKYVEAHMKSLQAQAYNGNQAAAQAIIFASNIKILNAAQIKQAKEDKKQADSLTQFFSTLKSNFDKVWGGFKLGFSNGLANIFGPMDGKDFENTILNLKNLFEKLGTSLGDHFAKWINNLSGPDGQKTIDGFFDGISRAGTVLVDLVDGLLTLGDWITSIMKPIRATLSFFGIGLGDVVKSLTEIGVAMWGFKKILNGFNMFKSLFNWLKSFIPGGAPAPAAAAEGAGAEVAEVAGGGGLLGMLKKSAGRIGGAGRGLLGRFGLGGAEAVAEGGAMAEGGSLMLGGLIGLPGLAIAGGAAVGMGGNYLADKYIKNHNSLAHKAASIGSDAAGGALAGAGIGALFGGVTAVPGALIGGALGGAYGLYKNWGDEEKKPDAPKADDAPQNDDNQPSVDSQTERENHDNFAKMVDQMTEQTAVLHMMLTTLNSRLTETNRLLTNTNRTLS